MKAVRVSRFLAPPPNAKHPSRPRPKTLTISKGLEELTREDARVQRQPVGREDDSETSDESVPLPARSLARIVSGRRHYRSRTLVEHMMCRDGKSEASLFERRAVEKQLAATREIIRLRSDRFSNSSGNAQVFRRFRGLGQ